MSEELKACPFCGSDEVVASVNFRDGKPYDYIVCPTANCYVSGQHNDPDELLRWWNTRPSITEEKIEEMSRRLVDLLGKMGDEDWPYDMTDEELDKAIEKRFADELRKHIGEVKSESKSVCCVEAGYVDTVYVGSGINGDQYKYVCNHPQEGKKEGE